MPDYISDRRLYLDKDGKMVEADDPTRTTLLVAAGGKLSAEDAAKYGLTGSPVPEEKSQAAPPANKANAKAPANKAAPAPEATSAAADLAEEEGVDLSEVEGSGEGGRILKSDVEKAAKE